jgi:hypothetical protein
MELGGRSGEIIEATPRSSPLSRSSIVYLPPLVYALRFLAHNIRYALSYITGTSVDLHKLFHIEDILVFTPIYSTSSSPSVPQV